jgi:hypothetical protein
MVELIEGVRELRPWDYAGDGYENMGGARRDGWNILGEWRGRVIGDWPYQWFATRERGARFELVCYTEGDTDYYTFDTRAARAADLDAQAR